MTSGTDSPRNRHGGRFAATLALILSTLACASITPGSARGADVGEALRARLAGSAQVEVPVVVTLEAQVDQADYAGRPAALVRALRATAARTQSGVTEELDGPARRFWLVNAVATSIDAGELKGLEGDPAVAAIDLDPRVRVTSVSGSPDHGGGSWGVGAIRAPEVWSRYGITGAGVRIGSIDTGVDPSNPELAGAIAGWRDFVAGSPAPYDDNGHGTHTVGTMVARNVAGAPIGVAPGAQAIVAKAIRADGTAQGSELLAAAQWLTDPDGDPATADFPAVINNSWTAPGADNEWFRPMVQTWVAMGIAPVFGAGNTAGSIGNPASYPEAIAVGALEESGQVATDSSRGFVTWTINGTPTAIAKPDITAPGTFITSTLGTGYGMYSGSSMAAPHVAATIALLHQARPHLTVDQLRELLRATAVDRGVPGPDLDYGAGALDAAAAVAATGAPQLAPASAAAPLALARAAKTKVRVLKVVRRGRTLIVQGRITGAARLRATVRRGGAIQQSLSRATRSVRVRAGRFVLRVPTRGLTRGRYLLVVVASNSSGERLGATSRAIRLAA
jgi:subtilisin family serine protease